MHKSASVISSENAQRLSMIAPGGNTALRHLFGSISYPTYLKNLSFKANRPSPAPKSTTLEIFGRSPSMCFQVARTSYAGI